MYSWKLPSVNSSLNVCIIFNWNSDVFCVFKLKTWRVQYHFENVFFSIPNLGRCKTFKSKHDAFWIFYFKIWRVRKNEFKIWLVLKFFSPKSEFYHVFQILNEWRFFLSTLITTFWGGKINDNVCCSFSRQMYNWKLPDVNSSLNACKTFEWKSDVLCFLKMKKWRVQYDFENVFFSISKLTRCKPLKSKSDACWNFQFKIMLFKKSTKNAKYVVFTE